jgi:hypothetical protein
MSRMCRSAKHSTSLVPPCTNSRESWKVAEWYARADGGLPEIGGTLTHSSVSARDSSEHTAALTSCEE